MEGQRPEWNPHIGEYGDDMDLGEQNLAAIAALMEEDAGDEEQELTEEDLAAIRAMQQSLMDEFAQRSPPGRGAPAHADDEEWKRYLVTSPTADHPAPGPEAHAGQLPAPGPLAAVSPPSRAPERGGAPVEQRALFDRRPQRPDVPAPLPGPLPGPLAHHPGGTSLPLGVPFAPSRNTKTTRMLQQVRPDALVRFAQSQVPGRASGRSWDWRALGPPPQSPSAGAEPRPSQGMKLLPPAPTATSGHAAAPGSKRRRSSSPTRDRTPAEAGALPPPPIADLARSPSRSVRERSPVPGPAIPAPLPVQAPGPRLAIQDLVGMFLIDDSGVWRIDEIDEGRVSRSRVDIADDSTPTGNE